MRQKDIDLLNFLFETIPAQIKDYGALSRVGVGPDAHLIARLTSHEVSALLSCVDRLLSHVKSDGIDSATYAAVLAEVEFYMDQEYLRGRAGFLVDNNNIHNVVYGRAERQIKKLREIQGLESELKAFEPVMPLARQHQHDSYAIAYFIVDAAYVLMTDPTAELEAKTIFGHGLPRMRQQALQGGRYHEKEVEAQLKEMHANCEAFLKTSPLQKSTNILTVGEARAKQAQDLQALSQLQEKFERLKQNRSRVSKAKSYCSSSFFFKLTAAVVGVTAIASVALRN